MKERFVLPIELRQSPLQRRLSGLARTWTTLLPFQAFVKWISGRTSWATIHGLRLKVCPGVFHPKLYFSSMIFARYLRSIDLTGQRLLEIGTGTGILAMEAARKGAQVVAVDVSPVAVSCARDNVTRNALGDRVRVVESDLFTSLETSQRFDSILWNPPFFPQTPADDPEQAWYAGSDYESIRRFAAQAPRFLAKDGSVFLLVSTVMDLEMLVSFFETGFRAPQVVDIRRRVFETFAILRYDVRGTLMRTA